MLKTTREAQNVLVNFAAVALKDLKPRMLPGDAALVDAAIEQVRLHVMAEMVKNGEQVMDPNATFHLATE